MSEREPDHRRTPQPGDTYLPLYSDVRGVCRVYEMSIRNGERKLWREGQLTAG